MQSFKQLYPLASSSKCELMTPKRSARRCLFGRPDQKETELWLKEKMRELDEKARAQMEKFGFDFDTNTSIPSSSSTYVFTAVPAASVPQFYRFTRYKKNDLSDSENRSPDSSDSDNSLEGDRSPTPSVSSRNVWVPRTPRKQTKLTSFLRVEKRKRLQRSAKVEDLCGSKNSSVITSPLVRHYKTPSH